MKRYVKPAITIVRLEPVPVMLQGSEESVLDPGDHMAKPNVGLSWEKWEDEDKDDSWSSMTKGGSCWE